MGLIRVTHFIISVCIIGSLASCQNLFEYSPYDAKVSTSQLNKKNIQKIVPINPADTLWIIALADSHHWYDDLTDAVRKINTLSNISFVIVCGDVTDAGLAREFEWYKDNIEKLQIPYITIIGNHDYRSNGDIIYKKMFGPLNFTFDVAPYHFIGFDNITWENKNSWPDFEWLNTQFKDDTTTIQVVFAHVPPWSEELDISPEELEQATSRKPDNTLFMYGHVHRYKVDSLFENHIAIGDISDRELYLLGLCDTSFVLKRLGF